MFSRRCLRTIRSFWVGDLIDPQAPRRRLLISREIPFAGDDGNVGRIDHVLIDQMGADVWSKSSGLPTSASVVRSSDNSSNTL